MAAEAERVVENGDVAVGQLARLAAHEVEVALAMVRRGRVQVEFNRPQDTADETEQEH